MSQHVTTFWYVDTPDPAAVFRTGTPSDPGFARRLLSRLYPTVTVASLGRFPLNRSASAGAGEIYIGSFPGLTVVQTPVPDVERPSALDPMWLGLVEAPVVLAFARDWESDVSSFARWESGRLVRSFSGADDRIVEDEGIPLPFERPYWAGEFPLTGHENDPLALPFAPNDLLHAAHRDWLGFDLSPDGVDVPVHGFATDGRREIRHGAVPTGVAMHLAAEAGRARIHQELAASTRASGDDTTSPYSEDDYERHPARRAPRDHTSALDSVRSAASALGRGALSLGRRAARKAAERRR